MRTGVKNLIDWPMNEGPLAFYTLRQLKIVKKQVSPSVRTQRSLLFQQICDISCCIYCAVERFFIKWVPRPTPT